MKPFLSVHPRLANIHVVDTINNVPTAHLLSTVSALSRALYFRLVHTIHPITLKHPRDRQQFLIKPTA